MAGEIVLGYDGEPGSRAALQTAVAIAAAFKRPLVVAFGYAPAPIGGDVADLSKVIEDIGNKITAEAVQIAHDVDPSVAVKTALVNDRPAEADPAGRRGVRRAGDRGRGGRRTRAARGRAARLGHLSSGTPFDTPGRGRTLSRRVLSRTRSFHG